jgi:plastocyanin
MRKEIGIFIVLFSVFLAIGCTGSNQGQTANETISPAAIPVNTPVAPAGTPQPISQGKIVDVTIQNFAFNPPSVEISTGDTVRWTNKDSVEHTVSGPTFSSGLIPKGQNYEFLFTTPGVYNYNCSIHPSMKGTVTVVKNK